MRDHPGEADEGRELFPVRAVRLLAGLHGEELRRCPRQHAGLEEVSDAGDSPDAFFAHPRVRAVLVDEGKLNVPAYTVVEGEVRADAPGVLPVKRHLALPVAVDGGDVAVLQRLLVEAERTRDGRNAPGED